MKKQWKRLAALSSAAVMAAGTLLYFAVTVRLCEWRAELLTVQLCGATLAPAFLNLCYTNITTE